MLRRMGVNYSAPLGDAKATLNRFLRNDASVLGINEIGNGNNRNLMVQKILLILNRYDSLMPV